MTLPATLALYLLQRLAPPILAAECTGLLFAGLFVRAWWRKRETLFAAR